MLACIVTSCGNDGKKSTNDSLTGAGATFPQPYYSFAFKTIGDSTGLEITYGGIGSGGGLRSLKDRIVDFAGSDVFLSDKEVAEMPGATIHIPTCIGAVALAYNLPGVDSLKLTGDIVADIYAGNITRWNDNRLSAINPSVKLPDLDITPVYRSDGSGTTFVFTDYLSKINENWNNSIGRGKSLKFPAGIAAKGNPGIAGTISQTKGTIGYIGSEYAATLRIPIASLMNQKGEFVMPTPESITASASAEIPEDTRVMLTNSTAEGAYPISCFTWILIYEQQQYANRSETHAKALIKMIDWMLSPEIQSYTSRLNYAPLPENVIAKARKNLSTVKYGTNNL